jgi:hypothetical protein
VKKIQKKSLPEKPNLVQGSWMDFVDPGRELHAGVSSSSAELHYVIVSRKKGRLPHMLAFRTGANTGFKMCSGVVVHIDLGNAPVILVAGHIGAVTPEEWIDKNENKVIPSGMPPADIINEWCEYNGMIYSATVTKNSYSREIARLPLEKSAIASVSPPLWNLALLYTHYFSSPFIIWKINSEESILGYVRNGRLEKNCNFWAGLNTILNDGINVEKDVLPLVKSLAGNDSVPVIVFCPGTVPESLYSTGKNSVSFIGPPSILGLGREYHEAYALAMQEDTHPDFATYEQIQVSRRLTASRKTSLMIIRAIAGGLAAIFILMVIAIAGTEYAGHLMQARLEPVKKNMQEYKAEVARLSKLEHVMREKVGFLSKKSNLTYPITEFQSVFPEGVWADDITLKENSPDSWLCVITASSASSMAIPVFLRNLSSLGGVSAVHMVYSEQTATPYGRTGDHIIKFKIEAYVNK